MGGKQIGGPVAGIVIAVVVVLVVGLGYFMLNRDHMGAEAVARKAGPPGVVPKGADPKMGPFPSDTLPNGQKAPAGMRMPGAGAPPPGANVGTN